MTPDRIVPENVPIHASCVSIGGAAVLLLGPSGAGKSDLALRLIDRGAMLVADDQVQLSTTQGQLLARPPANISGMIEVRNLGIFHMEHEANVPVKLAITLDDAAPRYPLDRQTMAFCGIPVPHARINSHTQSAPIKVEMALKRAIAARQSISAESKIA
ncbi:MAG: HPr kinase/phosphatase C-terminal domain-containing protein [Parasphingorhabdus sp.]|nr:HPr kinase/phosphatase C-terminal domain-containing protein [Parasphingorhabdus sp.]